jgi:diketogulonate reductase-like aldo/keto reductase
VKDAIDIGYRHFDSAMMYGNDHEVGAAVRAKIADGTVKREELFITNKVSRKTSLFFGHYPSSSFTYFLRLFDEV